ncbi:MAG: hypothetical protein KF778_16605 [Rhodocyclaceae bacterium]|nr:hypothetical protein [Rhodocyclaceae bacterium]MBX3670023.1 hypothetical protein [Rhodocyclaceae bacterium]
MRRLVASLAALVPGLWAPLVAAAAFRFALIGDLPYSAGERQLFPQMLESLDREALAFVIHDGDFKDGDARCDAAVYLDRRTLFEASWHPFIYTPGDNDWTDCQRSKAGAYDPAERLRYVRRLFFSDPRSLGRNKISLEHQSDDPRFPAYRENLRWRHEGILFFTLNIPGSRNNWGKASLPGAEFLDRLRANTAWMEAAFAQARRDDLAGVVVVIQANPGFEAANAGFPQPAYRPLLEQLQYETQRYAGQVLFVHGDTHSFRFDRPLLHPQTRQPLQNFRRVETFGHPWMGWVEVEADARREDVFRIQGQPWAPQRQFAQ